MAQDVFLRRSLVALPLTPHRHAASTPRSSSSSSSSASSSLSPTTSSVAKSLIPAFQSSLASQSSIIGSPASSLSLSPLLPAEDLPLSDEQQRAFDIIVEHKRNVFLTGCGGTGKSTLLRKIIEAMPRESTSVCAPTGIAAGALPRGTTIHRWAGIGKFEVGNTPAESRKFRKIYLNQAIKNRLEGIRSTSCLIIDEISMVSAELFEFLDAMARNLRGVNSPFGGMQLVLVGDFYQLPPVKGEFCFTSALWPQAVDLSIELKQVFRQTDAAFVRLLSRVRVGDKSPDVVRALDQQCGAGSRMRAASAGSQLSPPSSGDASLASASSRDASSPEFRTVLATTNQYA